MRSSTTGVCTQAGETAPWSAQLQEYGEYLVGSYPGMCPSVNQLYSNFRCLRTVLSHRRGDYKSCTVSEACGCFLFADLPLWNEFRWVINVNLQESSGLDGQSDRLQPGRPAVHHFASCHCLRDVELTFAAEMAQAVTLFRGMGRSGGLCSLLCGGWTFDYYTATAFSNMLGSTLIHVTFGVVLPECAVMPMMEMP
ncbi:hypothetical protein HPB49_003204 [Dermacentor silvarum]|uniref:Uncharacterized protein n=1 Tax=Dermacentor silvarum TaxID=543639 RepID=A0ACB8DTQ0_DERSI|nr:hypothetical protein HPB49_003204 [Dermacentor silvarum]